MDTSGWYCTECYRAITKESELMFLLYGLCGVCNLNGEEGVCLPMYEMCKGESERAKELGANAIRRVFRKQGPQGTNVYVTVEEFTEQCLNETTQVLTQDGWTEVINEQDI